VSEPLRYPAVKEARGEVVKLVAVTVQKFRNFVEPQRIEIEPDVTALVGKNESGKTTILKALHRLNPANGESKRFDLVTEYPRWRLARDRRENPNLEAETWPVIAEFVLDQDDVDSLADVLPVPPLLGATLKAAKNYANYYTVYFKTELATVIEAACSEAAVASEEVAALKVEKTLDAAIAKSKELSKSLKESGEAARARAVGGFASSAEKHRYLLELGKLDDEQIAAVRARVPKFFYFSNYSVLPGESDLTRLAADVAAGVVLEEQDQTVVSLLAHAGVTPADFLDANYDSRKAELQAAAGDLSGEVFKYWRVNTDLAVVFGDDNIAVPNPSTNVPENHRLLKIELRDARHGDVETNFSTRSSGFQWFFSFFAAFSEYLHTNSPVIVLLDEPGTSLHGEAQKDFVDYIFKELGASKQTVYTTHSQFMIDPTVYEKLRAVHDKATREDREGGVAVTQVSLSADRDTILPVESALGYSISQHLFLGSGPHLAVEGSSDFIFLMRMSAYMEQNGKAPLSPKLAIIPVGGISNMPAFVALMGRRLKVSALVDGATTDATLARTRKAALDNGVDPTTIVAISEVDLKLPSTADIEDLFATSDYLRLYNWAFSRNVKESDLPTTPIPIVKKLIDMNGKYDHALPAHALTDNQEAFFAAIKKDTVSRFEKLFEKLNQAVET
jgi:energy-coupling factor transporter ATP-binding protein EcfA2